MTAKTNTINLVIAALGGEGGGVLSNWLIDVADQEGWLCQSTSLAGVAQRTGATIYYLEMFPRSDIGEGQQPVMSLFPAQGDIDIAIASEIAEAGRMVMRGFVTPDRTTLIASDHRVYGITEKQHLADGVVDAATLNAIAGRYARDFVHYDMQALASEYGTVISAILFGAVAGSGALPFQRDSFEAVIKATGKAVSANLAAFEASYRQALACREPAGAAAEHAGGGRVEVFDPNRAVPTQPVFQLPPATTARGRRLLDRISSFPAGCQEVLYHGLLKLIDYQDEAYADQYLDALAPVLSADTGWQDYEVTRESARYLALWMCFEDIPRVAQLKTRASRMEEVRAEVRSEPGQLLRVTEFFHPRVEEMCAMLPARWGRRVQQSAAGRRMLGWLSGGRRLRTDTVTMQIVLRLLAGGRRWRRSSLGYQHEHALIARWLTSLSRAAQTDILLAREVAELGRLVKGYGDTRLRTTGQVECLLERLEQGACSAEQLARWREAALADDEGSAFEAALAA